MLEHPLEPPANRKVLERFLRHFELEGVEGGPMDPRRMLGFVARAFARIPYENLTKVVKESDRRDARPTLRSPREVIEDHILWGAGGTCFALTATLLHLVRALGLRAEPILADRRYGADTHCALVVWIDDRLHLIDPGYLIVDPIPLGDAREQRRVTSFNEVILTPRDEGQKWDLATVQNGGLTYRLTFKVVPVDAGQFLRAWYSSFDWEMMKYPVLTLAAADGQRYLQGRRFQTRTREGVARWELTEEQVVQRIVGEFGLAPELVRRAVRAWEQRGE